MGSFKLIIVIYYVIVSFSSLNIKLFELCCCYANSKASRCYQKAFDLDPNSDAAGIALGDSLMELEDEVDKTFLLISIASDYWLL